MTHMLSRAPARMRINLLLLGLFFGLLFLFGGASRTDVLSLPLVRVASVIMIAIAAIQLDRDEWLSIRVPALFLLTVALVIALQLVPLPPDLWFSLPGRAMFHEALRVSGTDGSWRPLSFTPDLTMNSLLAILPPLATVIALGTIDRAFHRMLVPLLLAGIAINGVVGLMQMSSGGPYFYSITNEGAAVGFFSNRNHLAILTALAFPLLACWTMLRQPDPARRRIRSWVALCGAAAIFPLLLTTGSRTGLLLGVAGAVLAIFLRFSSRGSRRPGLLTRLREIRLSTILPLGIGAIAVVAAVALSRDVAIDRLLSGNVVESRANYLPVYIQMVKDYFPTGAGFGSFDPVFRIYEPSQTLSTEYMNQAHNDLAQVLIEGGVTALLLMGLFLIWFAVRSWLLWLRPMRSEGDLLGRTGSIMGLMMLAGSLAEYPLRTPVLSAVIGIVCCWMLAGRSEAQTTSDEANDGVGSHDEFGYRPRRARGRAGSYNLGGNS